MFPIRTVSPMRTEPTQLTPPRTSPRPEHGRAVKNHAFPPAMGPAVSKSKGEGTAVQLQIPAPKLPSATGDVRGRSKPASRDDMPVTALDDEIAAGAGASASAAATGPRGRSKPASNADMPVAALDDEIAGK